MTPLRRSLCIVSRDPLQCSELVLSLQASLEPDDEVEIIMDRRRARDLFETESRGPDPPSVDRRRHTDVDLEVRTKGFAIVPGAAMPRATEEPDAEDRARFENILSFRRRHERRPGRAVGAASAVMVALILMPPLDIFPDRNPGDATRAEVTKPEPAEPAPRIGHVEPSGSAHTPAVGGQAPSVPAPASASRRPSNPPETRATRARTSRAPRPSKTHDVIEEYAARVEDATGRVVSKARGLIDRVKSEVIGNAPMHAGSEPPGEDAPPTVTRRRADSP